MPAVSFNLYFSDLIDAQLMQTSFNHPLLPLPHRTIRGKTQGAFFGYGTFEWTRAVRAMSILFVKSKLAGVDYNARHLCGLAGSLAASLDYALDKQPGWMSEMFGTDAHGAPLLRGLIARTNPGRKRPGPVILAVRAGAVMPEEISISVDNKLVDNQGRLHELLSSLEQSEPSIKIPRAA